MRYVMRIAKSSESSKLWTQLALPSGSMSVGVSVLSPPWCKSWSRLSFETRSDVRKWNVRIYSYIAFSTKNLCCFLICSLKCFKNQSLYDVMTVSPFFFGFRISRLKACSLKDLIIISEYSSTFRIITLESDLQSDKITRWI